MENLHYIVESWINNLDVDPYRIDTEEAAEIIRSGCIKQGDTSDAITPETIRDTWNGIIDSMLETYTVKVRCTGYYTVTVEAEKGNPEAAAEKALLLFEYASNDDIKDVYGDAYSVTDAAGKTHYMD